MVNGNFEEWTISLERLHEWDWFTAVPLEYWTIFVFSTLVNKLYLRTDYYWGESQRNTDLGTGYEKKYVVLLHRYHQRTASNDCRCTAQNHSHTRGQVKAPRSKIDQWRAPTRTNRLKREYARSLGCLESDALDLSWRLGFNYLWGMLLTTALPACQQ